MLDTNVVSEIRKIGSGKADAGVAAWAEATDPAVLYLSVITVLELERGILQKKRKDPKQAAVLKRWLHENVLPAFDGRILPVTTEIALSCAALHIPNPQPANDALIAATALQHKLIVVTRNTADFSHHSGLRLFNPFQSIK